MSVQGAEEQGTDARAIVYCIVPRELAAKLHEPLRRHFRDDPSVEVIVERRGRERRHARDRRGARARAVTAEGEPAAGERRRVRNPQGRRVGERRATVVPAAARELPRRARAHADRLIFVERFEPTGERAEDLDSARLVMRFQAGDGDAFAALYMRYFDRVYSHLRVLLKDRHEAEDATQQVFLNALEALPRYERRRQPFRAWLFTIVRNQALNRFRERRPELLDPAEIGRHVEPASAEDAELRVLGWISDQDLLVLIERLPLPQRQALTLRYMLDLSAIQIAAILDRSPDDVRMLQHRGQRFLRERLTALGRRSDRRDRTRMRRRVTEATVLRARRFSITR